MSTSFDPLWEALLRGGVARGPARRYVAELRDHLDDLIAEERRAGADEPTARTRALARLGDVEGLAGAMIARREFRAWGARAPLLTYVIAPPLALVACTTAAMAAIVIKATWLSHHSATPIDLPTWLHALAADVVLVSNSLLAVVLGWALGMMAMRHRSPSRWPVLGMIVLAAVGAGLQLDVTLPSALGHGEIAFDDRFVSLTDWLGYGGRFSVNLALTLAPYLALDRWRAAHAHGAPLSA
jgi:hypothetical protein